MASKLGWIVAGLLVVGLLTVIVVTVIIPSPSRPTSLTLKAGFLDLKEVKTPLSELIGSMPSGAGNAADNYVQAVAIAVQKEEEIGQVAREKKGAEGMAALKRIADLVSAGAAKASMEYTFTHTPKSFEVGYRYQPAVDLQKVSGAMYVLATTQYEAKQFAAAEKVLKDMLVMGWHMIRERARVHMVRSGYGVQMDALEGLQSVYSAWGGAHAAKLNVIADYLSDVREILREYDQKQQICWTTKPSPGDIYHIVEKDQDRAWRVQGLMALGMLKFKAESRGDTRKVDELLNRYSNSSDPFEQAAARAAKALTLEEFRQLGTKF